MVHYYQPPLVANVDSLSSCREDEDNSNQSAIVHKEFSHKSSWLRLYFEDLIWPHFLLHREEQMTQVGCLVLNATLSPEEIVNEIKAHVDL